MTLARHASRLLPVLLALLAGLAPSVPLGAQTADTGPARIQTFRLPSGLEVQLRENHDRPIVRLEFVDRWDPSEEPAGRPGFPAFLFEVLGAAGAGPHPRGSFRRAMDDQGIRFARTLGPGRMVWSIVADSRSQGAAFESLAHAVMHPILDAPLVDAQRLRLLREAQVASPREAAMARFLRALGDAGAPPDGAELEGVGLQDLVRFMRRVLRPEHARLSLSGDLNLAQAKELAYLHLGAWGPGAEPALALAPPPKVPTIGQVLAVPDDQAPLELWCGTPRAQAPEPEGFAELLGPVLEQALQDRLLSPWASVTLEAPSGPRGALRIRAWGLETGPNPSGRAAEAFGSLLGDLRALHDRGIDAQALQRAKAAWGHRRAALGLHPGEGALLQALGRQDDGLAEAVAGFPLDRFNTALAARLAPETLRCLALGFPPGFEGLAAGRMGAVRPTGP
jgi:hypothetical protein